MELLSPSVEPVLSLHGYVLLRRPEPKPPALHPELALLLTTSGSTGSPKLVRQRRRNTAYRSVPTGFLKQGATSLVGAPHTCQIFQRIGLTEHAQPTPELLSKASGKLPEALHRHYADWAEATGRRFVVMHGPRSRPAWATSPLPAPRRNAAAWVSPSLAALFPWRTRGRC